MLLFSIDLSTRCADSGICWDCLVSLSSVLPGVSPQLAGLKDSEPCTFSGWLLWLEVFFGFDSLDGLPINFMNELRILLWEKWPDEELLVAGMAGFWDVGEGVAGSTWCPVAAGRLWELAVVELAPRSLPRLRPRWGEIRLKKLLMDVLTERLAGVSWLEVGLLAFDTAVTELDLPNVERYQNKR